MSASASAGGMLKRRPRAARVTSAPLGSTTLQVRGPLSTGSASTWPPVRSASARAAPRVRKSADARGAAAPAAPARGAVELTLELTPVKSAPIDGRPARREPARPAVESTLELTSPNVGFGFAAPPSLTGAMRLSALAAPPIGLSWLGAHNGWPCCGDGAAPTAARPASRTKPAASRPGAVTASATVPAARRPAPAACRAIVAVPATPLRSAEPKAVPGLGRAAMRGCPGAAPAGFSSSRSLMAMRFPL